MQANENESYESYVPDEPPREDLERNRRPEIEHPIPDEETQQVPRFSGTSSEDHPRSESWNLIKLPRHSLQTTEVIY